MRINGGDLLCIGEQGSSWLWMRDLDIAVTGSCCFPKRHIICRAKCFLFVFRISGPGPPPVFELTVSSQAHLLPPPSPRSPSSPLCSLYSPPSPDSGTRACLFSDCRRAAHRITQNPMESVYVIAQLLALWSKRVACLIIQKLCRSVAPACVSTLPSP